MAASIASSSMITLNKQILCSNIYSKCIIQSFRSAMFWQKGKKEAEIEEVESTPLPVINTRPHLTKKQTGSRTIKGYKPPDDLEEKLQQITQQVCGDIDGNWKSVTLDDRRVKFRILSKLMTDLDHNIGNFDLSSMKNIEDVLAYFQTEVRDSSVYEDLSKLDLPKNLHIEMNSLKFDAETDTMFDGKTAFPKSKNVIYSLRKKHRSNFVD